MLEVLLVSLMNAQKICAGVMFIYGCCAFCEVIFRFVENDLNSMRFYRYWKWAIVPLIVLMAPDPSDIYRVRIDLLKFRLASPENVMAGVERIDEIANKLECKYLGCKEPTPARKAAQKNKAPTGNPQGQKE